MKKSLLSIVILIVLSIVFYPPLITSKSNGSGNGGGNTNSPGDNNNCTSCHGGTINSGNGTSSISTNIPSGGYVPGSMYTVTMNVSETGINKFGFETTSEDLSNNKLGTFFITNSSETQLTNSNTAVTHTTYGNSGTNDSRVWTFDWEAPLSGSGNITFYSSALAANSNGNSNGDQVYTSSLMVSELIATPGCTDSLAINYDPTATTDDGSCAYPCLLNEVSLNLFDSFGDGWDGGIMTVNGVDYTLPTGAVDSFDLCIDMSGCTDLIYTPGSFFSNIENSWNVTDASGAILAAGLDASGQVGNGCVYPLPPAENLFFSEWGEGSFYNKYFEIFNPTNDTIDLSNYAYTRVNGNPTTVGVYEYWNDFDSGSVILPMDVFIVAHSTADSIIQANADMLVSGSTALSNGDDGMALVYGNEPSIPMAPDGITYVIVDWLGDWNGDPGQGWDVAGVVAGTRNHTLIRKCPISKGDTSWTNAAGTDPVNSQWIVLGNNDWTNIGFHNTCVCDSSTNSYTSIYDTICNGLSIVVGNNTYDSTGVYSDTLLAFNGCDSIITTNLIVLSTSASNVINDVTICDGDSVIVGINVYDNTGSYTDILVNSAGCDSIITTNLTVQTPTYQDITICDGDSIVVGNSVYNSSGSYTDTIQSSILCDSIVHTNLTIYSQFLISGGIPNNTVGGGGYYSGSQYLELSCYMASELVSAVIYSADTTLTTFEIRDNNGNVLDSVTVNIIPGGHRIYFNYNMTAGSDYEIGVNGSSNDLYRNNSGVNYPYNFASAAAVTSSSAGGNHYYFFYDIQVRVLSTAAITTNYSFCDGDSITVAGSVYSMTGLYTDSLISSLGCDSLVYSNVVVSPHVSYINNQTICSGETYLINGNVYDSTGTYIDFLHTLHGCDSIVTTHLNVDSITGGSGINNHTICIGDSVVVGAHVYYHDGVYHDTLVSSNGCDSIVTTTLSVIYANYASINGGILDTAVAPGDYSNYDGSLLLDVGVLSLLKSATVYAEDTNNVTFELRDDNGVVLQAVTHTVYPGVQSLIFNFMIQPGTDYQLGIDGGNSGLYRNNAGSGNSLAYPFSIGPVSITSSNAGSQYYYFYYDIEIMPFSTYNEINICHGDSIIVGGNIYDTPGQYLDNFIANNSCDSVVFTVLDFYQSPPLFIQTSPDPPEICIGETILLEGSAGFSYYWWDNGSTGNSLIDDPTVDTWYLLSAKDSNDCVVKEDIWVFVDSCITSINDLSHINEMQLYPNPVSEQLTIDFTAKATTLKVYNMLGELLFEKNILEGQYRVDIDVKDWKSAIYSVQLCNKDRVIAHKVFNVAR